MTFCQSNFEIKARSKDINTFDFISLFNSFIKKKFKALPLETHSKGLQNLQNPQSLQKYFYFSPSF